MEFLSGNVGTEIIEEIERADAVDIASEHFHPGDGVVELLSEVSELRIYVSEDFTTSDPSSLESLAANSRVQCIPPDNDIGKFNDRMVLCHRKDNTEVAFVGSFNFTGSSLFSNHEDCFKLDTRNGDRPAVESMKELIMELEDHSHAPDWNRASRRHETTKTTPDTAQRNRKDTNYWILKTRGRVLGSPTKDKVDHWNDFRAEGVIAIGCTELSFNPLGRSREEIKDRLSADGRNPSSAHVIDKFANGITVGDLVLLCGGYASPEAGVSSEKLEASEKVFFYGYARVKGSFYYDEESLWWQMKYPAAIQEEEVSLPREIFVETFDKEALPHPIHEKGITENRVEDFCSRLESGFGIPLRL